MLAEITVGDVAELLDVENGCHRPMGNATAFYRTLNQLGIFEADAPARLGELRSACQRTPAELIDRFDLACRPVRDLLVDYLCERQPALDYSSLRALASDWATCSGRTCNATIPASTACTCPPRSQPRGSSDCAPDPRRSPPPPARRRHSPRGRVGYRQCLTLSSYSAAWSVSGACGR